MTEAEQVMKRCQIGTRNYDEANNLHADCHRVIGKLLAEHAMREVQRLGQEIEQESVGVVHHKLTSTLGADYEQVAVFVRPIEPGTKLYTTPPQRKPLTHEEMKKIWYAMQNIMGWYSFQEIAQAIEAAHGIKGEA